MKKILTLLCTVLLTLGCSDPKEKEIIEAQKDFDMIKTSKSYINSQIPYDNVLYSSFINKKNKNLDEADKVYKSEISKAKNTPYYNNLKHIGFKFIMENGLTEKGTNSQKEFYLYEQIELKRNFPNFSNFYSLLISCKEFKNKSELIEISNQFYIKNKNEIDRVIFGEKENKKSKLNDLTQQQKLFIRYINSYSE
ncbi:hypothetical protein ACFS5J_02395 [Flavobacterium chuncheonense]|uniref:Lipoprotein n=1 Tax=Flavobacterium chuncheonense TaxID=2026653 RepID=A0ABW5YIP7_9FLAO